MWHFIIGVLIVLSISGCATIIDGDVQTVTINSEPSKAKVVMNGMPMGDTPLTINVKRSKTTVVQLRKEGYHDQQVQLQTRFNKITLLNFSSGGAYGFTTDYATDSMVEFDPSAYLVTLEPNKETQLAQSHVGNDKRIRNFILQNYDNLMSEIAKGEGSTSLL